MPEISLQKLSSLKIVELLKKRYWSLATSPSVYLIGQNPFRILPTHILEDLLSTVIRLTSAPTLSTKDVFPIISTGQIVNFRLEHICLTIEELVSILTALSAFGQHLVSVVLEDINRRYHVYGILDPKMNPLCANAVERLLSMAPNLEYIRTDLEFDLKIIQKVRSLKRLELNFVPRGPLYEMLPQTEDSLFIPNNTITHLSIMQRNHIVLLQIEPYCAPPEQIAFLLKYYPKLLYLENNISTALQYLHSEELFLGGSLSKTYRLENCTLGSFLYNSVIAASVTAIHIATLTCPFVKELHVLVNDHQAVTSLCDFKKLYSLLIRWAPEPNGDFRLGLQLLLNDIGKQLKKLTIQSFCNVDFAAIVTLCPNLEFLTVEYDSEVYEYDYHGTGLLNLKKLEVGSYHEEGIKAESLKVLLCNCPCLQSLSLETAPSLNDNVMKEIIKSNSLSELTDATIEDCALTEVGLSCFVKSCRSLHYFDFSSTNISFEMGENVIRRINPMVDTPIW